MYSSCEVVKRAIHFGKPDRLPMEFKRFGVCDVHVAKTNQILPWEVKGSKHYLIEAGVAITERLVVRANDNLLHSQPDPGEIEQMRGAMEKAGSYTAFFALNDRLLRIGVSILLKQGISIGNEVSLAAHGDATEVYPLYTYGIPRVVEPSYEMVGNQPRSCWRPSRIHENPWYR